ncbi:hypothetical protein [Streptomyces orinoci]|uniref:Uncharacterized protein n=1 Tax=Streptomyces orinoci TaxID=67339 RepID=A0ABV3JS52_STRON|nr:hypothetical protein [Streptomyces orinoci]
MVREILLAHDGTILRYDDWICNCGYRRPSREERSRAKERLPGQRGG